MKFSKQLEQLFTTHRQIKLVDLNILFGEKSFAFAFILLLMTTALPLPTGGITNFFEIIAALLAIELAVGRDRIWLPKRWENHKIKSPKPGKGMGRMVGFIRFFEKFSRPRGHFVAKHHLFVRFMGLYVLILTAMAFIAPPFSGLDTLPGLGVVVLGLGLVLDDLAMVLIGMIIGLAGVILIFALSGFIISSLNSFCVAIQLGICRV